MADTKISNLPAIPSTVTGAELVPIVQGGVTYRATAQQVASVASTPVSVKTYGAVGDGVTDDSLAIQNAINAVNATGNGGILFFPPGTYNHSVTLNLLSNVILEGYGAVLSWVGGASVQIDTASTGVTTSPGIVGLTISGGSATTMVSLRSAWAPILRDVTFSSASATNVCMDLLVNTSGSLNGDGNRNFAFGTFDNILQEGTCGTLIRMTGDATAPTVITLNTFSNINAQSCSVYGLNFVQWVDSNTFTGITRVSMASGTTSIGVVHNSGSPAANVGVYANNFEYLAVDTFGVSTNQVGLRFNHTKDNKVGYFFQDPPAAGGAFVTTADCASYDVLHQIGLANNMVHKVRNVSLSVDPVAGSAIWTLGGAGLSSFTYQFVAGAVLAYSVGTYYIGTTTAVPVIFSPNNAEQLRVQPVSAATSYVRVWGSTTGLPIVDSSSGKLLLQGLNSMGKVTAPTCAVDTTSIATSCVTNAAGTYTLDSTVANSTIIQTVASVYTLPNPVNFAGRKLHFVTQVAGTATSATANVVPLVGGAASTAILSNTAGKWATMQSNGTNWLIVAAN